MPTMMSYNGDLPGWNWNSFDYHKGPVYISAQPNPWLEQLKDATNKWIPGKIEFVPYATPEPVPLPQILLPVNDGRVDELEKRVRDLEKRLKRFEPDEMELDGEPATDGKRIVEP